jgi:hypothetical protein
MVAIERLDISPRNGDGILCIGKRFFYVNIYIQRIDESYARLKDCSILEIFIGIAENDIRWFHT